MFKSYKIVLVIISLLLVSPFHASAKDSASLETIPLRLAGVFLDSDLPNSAILENTSSGEQADLKIGDSLSELGLEDIHITKIVANTVYVRLASGQLVRLFTSDSSVSASQSDSSDETSQENQLALRREEIRAKFLEAIATKNL